MKYRPVRQHRQLRPRWDHACSSTASSLWSRAPFLSRPKPGSHPRLPALSLALLLGQLHPSPSVTGFVSFPRIPRSFPRFFFHSCRLAPSSRTWISVELSRSDDFNLSTGRKKSGTHSNRGEPPLVPERAPASSIFRPYIRPLFISFSLPGPVLSSTYPLHVLLLLVLFLPPAQPAPQTCPFPSSYLFLSLFSSPPFCPSYPRAHRAARCRKSVAPGLPRINETIRRAEHERG